MRSMRVAAEMLPAVRVRRPPSARPILIGLVALGLLAWALHSRGAFTALGYAP